MIINSREQLIRPDFKPTTSLGRYYDPVDSGNYRAIDYGASADVYDSKVTFVGTAFEMTYLWEYLQINPGRFLFPITCHAGEEIFGCNIDHTITMYVAAWEIGELTRVGLVTWELQVLLRGSALTALSGAGSLSTLRFKDHSYIATTDYKKNFSITGNGTISYTDHNDKDIGTFKATFLQKTSEMIEIRKYLINGVGRASSFSWASPDGIYDPFGFTPGVTSYNVRIIDWVDNGKLHPGWWTITLTFAQEK